MNSIVNHTFSLDSATSLKIMPHDYPFALLDRIRACDIDAGVSLSLKSITLSDPVLNGHFRDYPIYPGVLIIEALAQNCGVLLTLRKLCRELGSCEAVLAFVERSERVHFNQSEQIVLADSRIKHIQAVYPADTLMLEARFSLEREGLYVFRVAARVDDQLVAQGQITMATRLTPSVPSLQVAAVPQHTGG